MGRKKFIEKKQSATYRLVFKDSSSGGAIGEGTDRIFVRVDGGDSHVPGFDPDTEEEESGDDEREVEEVDRGRGRTSDEARQEMLELGFPDDGYNYLQHLREVGPSGRIGAFVPNDRARLDSLRPDVKAFDASRVRVPSTVEESSSNALNVSGGAHQIRGSTQKFIDTDVVALLNKEDDASLVSGDELEDDFVAMANEGVEDLSPESPEGSGSEDGDYRPLNMKSEFDDEADDYTDHNYVNDGFQHERPTRFLDEQFELLALREYDDDEIGELDDDDPSARGPANISKFNNVMSDFLINSTFSQDKYHTPAESKSSMADRIGHPKPTQSIEKENESGSLFMPGVDKSTILASSVLDESTSDEEKEFVLESDSDAEGGRWDCESIVTTYSNLDNHPGKICSFSKVSSKSTRASKDDQSVIRLRGKQQIPVDYLPKRGCAQGDGRKAPNQAKTVNVVRKSEETKEEKKARKAAIKEEKRSARALKKDMKLMYKDESQRAQRMAAFTGPAMFHL